MAKLDAMLELERRDELPEAQKNILAELRTRDDLPSDIRSKLKVAEQPPGLISTRELALKAKESQAKFQAGLGETGKALIEDLPETIGAIGGAGLAVGAGAAAPVVAGVAALGGGFGEAVKQIGQQIERGTGFDVPLVEGADAPQTSQEAANRIGKSITRSGVFELIGIGLARIGTRFINRFRPGLERGAIEAQELLTKGGGTLTLAQATTNDLIDVAQNAAGASVFGGAKVRKTIESSEKIVTNVINNFEKALSTKGDDVIGAAFQEAIENKRGLISNLGKGLYKQADDLTQPERLLQTVKESVQSNIVNENGIPFEKIITSTVEHIGKGGSDLLPTKRFALEALETLDKAVVKDSQLKSLLRNVIAKPDKVAFADAHIMRSDLLAIGRDATEVLKGRRAGIAKKLSSLIDSSMEKGAKELSGEALNAFRRADRFWKAGKTQLNDEIVKRIANTTNTDNIVKMVFSAKSSEQIKRVRRIVGSQRWKDVQGKFIRDFIQNPSNLKDNVLKFSQLEKSIERFGSKNVNEILEPAVKASFDKLIRIGKIAEKVQPTTTGKIFISLQQAGAFAAALTFNLSGTAAAILIGPKAIAETFTNPRVVNAIINGIQLGTKTRVTGSALARISEVLSREKIDHKITSGRPENPSVIKNTEKSSKRVAMTRDITKRKTVPRSVPSKPKKQEPFKVTVTAIRAKTGKKVKIKVDAVEALSDAKADVEKYKSFLKELE